jgi:hypothetical protein
VVFDKQGRHLDSIELSFYARSSRQQWEEFARATRLSDEKGAAGKASSRAAVRFNFVALPAQPKAKALYLRGGAHPPGPKHTSSAKVEPGTVELHWHLELERTPNDAPPEAMQRRSDRIGGYPTILENLSAAWPADAELKLDVKAQYILDSTRLRLAFDHRSGAERVEHLGPVNVKRSLAVTMWSVEPKSGPVERVMIAGGPSDPVILISVFGSDTTRLTPKIFDAVDAALWRGLSPLVHPVIIEAHEQGRRT